MKLSLLLYGISVVVCASGLDRTFPDEFIFGTASASYQIEDAWNDGGKGEGIWDRLAHTRPELFEDGTNGDVAADSYHKYKRDVEMMRELGLDAYRFSLSWPRLLPTGLSNEINEDGVAYYNNLINEMLEYKIQPMVTLYHWDLPQKLQDLGGWANPLIVEWYNDYAKVAFDKFGDRVKMWITMNEPREICHEGYGDHLKAPAIDSEGIGEYYCSKHLLLAHAAAYHSYNDIFKSEQGGRVGITISTQHLMPLTDSEADLEATELAKQGEWEQYAHPIFSKTGGWPQEFQKRIDTKSASQGFSNSRLPPFTISEVEFVRGSADFYGMNHYSARYVYRNESASAYGTVPSMYDDLEASYFVPEEWIKSASSWLIQAPNSLYQALKYVSDKYDHPEIYVTENGWSTHGGLVDPDRVSYLRAAWNDLLDALEDGVSVKGYMLWSIMDNLEWLEGISARLGIYEVDYEDPDRTRTPRMSAFVYKQLIKTRVIDENYSPDSMVMVIDDSK